MSEVEIWRPVVGHDGYEVSDLGRVRSVTRIHVYERRDQYRGRVLRIGRRHVGKILQPHPQASGHLYVLLGRGRRRMVHHLVLEAFVCARPPKPFEA